MSNILEVKDLKTYFYTEQGVVKAVDGVSFVLREGEVLGIVGESGCGKSVTALSIMGLVPFPGNIIEGDIYFQGKNLLRLKKGEMKRIRGNEISMVFQET
ncbi:MAG: ATP-binding cassette domain-containing protein, partial [bacterium]|nr:ATP-binding cassette domain-containing protein [bacterium]